MNGPRDHMLLGIASLVVAAIIGLTVLLLARRRPKVDGPDATPGAGASDAPPR